jgi:hypothetical protein
MTLGGVVITLTAFGDSDPRSDSVVASTLIDGRPGPGDRSGSSRRGSDADSSRLDAIRARADRAFDGMSDAQMRPPGRAGDTTSRGTSRIGPQPWPADLPTAWPRLESARVLADTRRDGDRLLLVDLPGSPDHAAAEYGEALRARGYAIDQTDGARVGRTIHVESPYHEAVLTFFPRDEITRIEILFLEKAAS